MAKEVLVPRVPVAAILGIVLSILGTLVYSYELLMVRVPTPGAVSGLTAVAVGYFVLVLICIGLVIYDVWRTFRLKIAAEKSKGVVPLSPAWMIPYVLSEKKYRRYFVLSSLLYGIFYAVITSMIVYQPAVDFAQAYGAAFPSIVVAPVFNAPPFSPVVTVYLANHLGLLLVPLTIVLLVATSLLVGLNFALVGFAFASRAKGLGRGWVGGLGAVVGLFTGCPTCAGLFFANFLGGTGAVSFATLLGYYQPAFILLSIPALLAAPYLTSRSLSKVFREGCVFIGRGA
ncbi:MAG TPA: hypothetical protein VGR56_00190 [Nitrososphaerales archaeon]|nr:hypothetical protein [Nitrososphaerales archaeon]